MTTTISEAGSGTEMESLLQLRSVSKTFGTGANQLEVLRDVTVDVFSSLSGIGLENLQLKLDNWFGYEKNII